MSDDQAARMLSKLDDINERLARVEAIFTEHEKYTSKIEEEIKNIHKSLYKQGERIGSVENAKAGMASIKEFILMLVAILSLIWGMIK